MAFPKHSHPGEELVYVVEGLLEYALEGRPPVTLKAGDVLFIPAGVAHAVKNVGSGNAAEIATYFFPASHIAAHPEVIDIFAGNSRDAAQKQRRARILTRPVESDLAAITAPTLVLVGAEDRLIPPAHTLALAQEIAGARTVSIAGLGHVGSLQDPQAVAREVLAFLRTDAIDESTTIPGGNHHDRAGGRSRRAVR